MKRFILLGYKNTKLNDDTTVINKKWNIYILPKFNQLYKRIIIWLQAVGYGRLLAHSLFLSPRSINTNVIVADQPTLYTRLVAHLYTEIQDYRCHKRSRLSPG